MRVLGGERKLGLWEQRRQASALPGEAAVEADWEGVCHSWRGPAEGASRGAACWERGSPEQTQEGPQLGPVPVVPAPPTPQPAALQDGPREGWGCCCHWQCLLKSLAWTVLGWYGRAGALHGVWNSSNLTNGRVTRQKTVWILPFITAMWPRIKG